MTRDDYETFASELYEQMLQLIHDKNTDYAQADDAFANFRQASDFGVDPLVGMFVRMGDKFQRLKAFSINGNLAVKGEGVEDALKDLVGYATLALAMLKQDSDV